MTTPEQAREIASEAMNVAAELVRHVCGMPEPRGKRHEDCASPEFVRDQAMRVKAVAVSVESALTAAHAAGRDAGLSEAVAVADDVAHDTCGHLTNPTAERIAGLIRALRPAPSEGATNGGHDE